MFGASAKKEKEVPSMAIRVIPVHPSLVGGLKHGRRRVWRLIEENS